MHPLRLIAMAVAATLWTTNSTSGQAAPPHVTDIRFGIVEPPVVAQRDITVAAPMSNQQTEPRPLECSGLAWDDGHLIIVSDRHGHIIFRCPVDLDRMTIGEPQAHVIIRNERELLDDAESIVVQRDAEGVLTAYVACSMSNDRGEQPLPQRRHMARFTVPRAEGFKVGRSTVLSTGSVRDALSDHMKALGIQPYRTHNPDFPGPDKNTYRWGNLEGIAFSPDGSSLLCGMRNPLAGGAAMVFALQGVPRAFDAANPGLLKVTDLWTLDLGQRGVSDLCWDPLTMGYLITAARSNGPRLNADQPFPLKEMDSALFWWSGRKNERPILFARFPDMTIEAACRLGSSRYIAVGSDEGDVSEGRAYRQSILTILDFPGTGRWPPGNANAP